MSLFSFMSVVLTFRQQNFSLQHMETITANHNLSKWRVMENSHNGYIYKATPACKAQGTSWRRRQKDYRSQRIREFAVKLSLLVKSEATLIKSHQQA